MSELTIQNDADPVAVREQVREFVTVGEEIRIHRQVVTAEKANRVSGTVASIDDEFLAIETDPGSVTAIDYADIDSVSKVSDAEG